MNKNQVIATGAILCLFSLVGALLVGLIYELTFERIIVEERNVLLQTLNSLIAQDRYDNALTEDTLTLQDPLLSRKPVTLYRARLQQQPVAVVISAIAPDGYNGAIKLLIAINMDERLAGVRVVSHKETPGLGDKIEIQKSAWITQFQGASLSRPASNRWTVKKDGGEFLQLTGATITPRAIIKAVHKALTYFKQHKTDIFSASNHT